jgi:hypothetical protein
METNSERLEARTLRTGPRFRHRRREPRRHDACASPRSHQLQRCRRSIRSGAPIALLARPALLQARAFERPRACSESRQTRRAPSQPLTSESRTRLAKSARHACPSLWVWQIWNFSQEYGIAAFARAFSGEMRAFAHATMPPHCAIDDADGRSSASPAGQRDMSVQDMTTVRITRNGAGAGHDDV